MLRKGIPVAALGLMLGAVVGCGGEGSKYVPVSGVVTINGKPYAKAMVSFQPEGGAGNIAPGRGSSGITDGQGRFTLKTDDGHDGALVGSHAIKIRTQGESVGYDPQVGSSDSAPLPNSKNIDPIPLDWRELGKHKFEVPAGGTKDANFDIQNPRYKN